MNDVTASAESMGLRYVDDRLPGITRKRWRKGFRYLDERGRLIRDQAECARIQALAIPPAWEDVWICRWHNGHIQATGRDARRRKQYRYHPRWRKMRDASKYDHMLAFAHALPAIRSKVDTALSMHGLPREKVLAVVVSLLENTMMRIGNREYMRAHNSYGMTTLRKRHVHIEGTEIQFEFCGKGGLMHSLSVHDKRFANIIRRMRDLPGQELFQYIGDDGERHSIASTDVNDYLRESGGGDYTAKDFRTWAGTVLAMVALQNRTRFTSEAQAKKNINCAIEEVAEKLGNTPAICRKCYIHPGVIDAYMNGSLQRLSMGKGRAGKNTEKNMLVKEEQIVLQLLEKNQKTPSRRMMKNAS